MLVFPAEKSGINQHKSHVGPGWFRLARAGLMLFKLVDYSHAVLK